MRSRYRGMSFGSLRMSDFGREEVSGLLSPDLARKSPGALARQSGGRAASDFDDDDDGVTGIGEEDGEVGGFGDDTTGPIRGPGMGRESLGFADVTMDVPEEGIGEGEGEGEGENTFRLEFDGGREGSMTPSQTAEEQRDEDVSFARRNGQQRSGSSPPASVSDDNDDDSPASSDDEPIDASPRQQQQQQQPLPSTNHTLSKSTKEKNNPLKLSRHSLPVPRLPSSLQKRLATRALHNLPSSSSSFRRYRKSQIGRDSLAAIQQATEWFFAQVGEDLEAFSGHARRRKRVVEGDVLALVGRQRVVGGVEGLRRVAGEVDEEEGAVGPGAEGRGLKAELERVLDEVGD
ncbi:MAG: hypothetical protein Q9227_001757 [Pyrenula ochraceoflavens]